ncbi:major facilitator superfamily protein [Stylonychia lemnae]|uniref:UNC93-like protein MFSD11 n=1 Tax=Stylonychia lemnae TaxID=5949 RepID=A0A078A585_STYLE|nr:major facilitator superfamily protein [Stylonychia lemnae]|eukprot:CDW76745.1 major facilitator superfamily protein [Stylonychia lemnae]
MRTSNYPNLKAVLYLSGGFFLQFVAVTSAISVVSTTLRECGFKNLGFYSLAVNYLVFGLCSLVAPPIIRKLKPILSMTLGSVCYDIWLITLSLPAILLKSEKLKLYFSYNQVVAIVLIASIIMGFGCALIWVGQGKYLSDCSKYKIERKGVYSSIFWFTFYISSILSSILAALILGSYPQEYLYFICFIISVLSKVILISLPKIQTEEQDQQLFQNNQPEQVDLDILKLITDKQMIVTYGVFLTSALSNGFRMSGLFSFLTLTQTNETIQNQFKYASYAQALFGIGQAAGSALFGYLSVKLKSNFKLTQGAIIVHIISYSSMIWCNELYKFGFLSFCACFFLGIQDSYLQNQTQVIMGAEFKQTTEAFAIFRLFNSVGVTFILLIISNLTNSERFRQFIIGSLLFSIFSQIIMIKLFKFRQQQGDIAQDNKNQAIESLIQKC